MKIYFLFLYMVNCEKIMNYINIPPCKICIYYRDLEFSTKLSPISFELEKKPLNITISKIGWYKSTIDYVSEPKLGECLKNQNQNQDKGTYDFSRKNEREEEKKKMIKILKDKIIKFLPHILLILSIIVSSLLNIYIMSYLVSKSLI